MSKKDKNLIINLVKNFIIDENEFEYKNIKKSEKLFSKNRKLSNVEKRKRFFSENDSLNFVPKLKPKISNIKPTVLRLNTKKSNSRNVRENLFSDVDQPLINSYENEDTESFNSYSSSDSDTSDEDEILIIKEENRKIERKVKKIKEELHECSDFESDEEENKLRFLKTILQVRKELIKYKVKINKNFSYKDDTLIEIGKSKIYKILDISEYFFNNNNLNYNQNNVNNNYNQNKQRHLSILSILENKLSVQ
jgi:hypothetical protein